MQRDRAIPTRHWRNLLAALLVGGLLAATVAFVAPAGAQSIDDKRAEAARVASELESINSRLMSLSAQAEQSRYELSKVEGQVAEAQERAEATGAELERRREDLRDFSVRAYIGGAEAPGTTALFSADGDTAPQTKMYIEVTAGNRSDYLDNLRAAEQQAKEDAEHLSKVQQEAARVAEQMETARSEAEQAASAQRALHSRVQGELAVLVEQEAARRAQEQEAAAAAARRATTSTQASRSSSGGSSSSEAPSSDPGPLRAGLAGAIDAALSRQGSPYVWGAEGPGAFDCSGLMVWAFRQIGISLPHYSGAQYNMTRRVSRADLQPGDLVFWGGGGSEHVALYMGGNQIVHSYGSGNGVGVTRLDGWWKTPSGYGRL